MAKPSATGLRRILNAGYYSFKGFKAGFKHEAAVRQELFLAIPLTLLSFYLADDLAVLLLLIILPWLTLAFELVNSAIEAVVDRIGNEYHELSGRAKDLGSACVFVLLILTLFAYFAAFMYKFALWSF